MKKRQILPIGILCFNKIILHEDKEIVFVCLGSYAPREFFTLLEKDTLMNKFHVKIIMMLNVDMIYLAYMGNKYVTILLLSYSLNRYTNKCYVLIEWNTLIFSLQFWLVFFYTYLLGPLGQDVACLLMIQTWQVLMSRWILMETTCNHIFYVCENLYDKAFSWWHPFI